MRRGKKTKKNGKLPATIAPIKIPMMSIEDSIVLVPELEYSSIQKSLEDWTGEEEFFAVCFDDGKGYRPVTKMTQDVYGNPRSAYFPLFQLAGSAETFARERRMAMKGKVPVQKIAKFKVVRGTIDDFKAVLSYLSNKEKKVELQVLMSVVWPIQIINKDNKIEEFQILDTVDQLYLD